MTEEERVKKLEKIEEEKNKMNELKLLKKRLNELKHNKDVMEYIKLDSMFRDISIKTTSEIKKDILRLHEFECSHDIYIFMGGYRVEYDCGPESRDSYFFETDKDKIEFYRYTCLECYHEKDVRKSDNDKFLEEHNVVKLKKKYVSNQDFNDYYNLYYDMLCTDSTDKIYKKLVKRQER